MHLPSRSGLCASIIRLPRAQRTLRPVRFNYYSAIAGGAPKLSLAPAVDPKETKVLHRDVTPERAGGAFT